MQNAINNITAAFASPYLIRHRDFFVTCTIGIAIFPDHGSFADELLRTAGLALHEAKTTGGNRGVIYSEHMRARSVARLELETELRRALEQNELFLVYQPQIEVASGRIASASKPWCAGAIRRAASCRRMNSSRSPRNPASSCRCPTW